MPLTSTVARLTVGSRRIGADGAGFRATARKSRRSPTEAATSAGVNAAICGEDGATGAAGAFATCEAAGELDAATSGNAKATVIAAARCTRATRKRCRRVLGTTPFTEPPGPGLPVDQRQGT